MLLIMSSCFCSVSELLKVRELDIGDLLLFIFALLLLMLDILGVLVANCLLGAIMG